MHIPACTPVLPSSVPPSSDGRLLTLSVSSLQTPCTWPDTPNVLYCCGVTAGRATGSVSKAPPVSLSAGTMLVVAPGHPLTLTGPSPTPPNEPPTVVTLAVGQDTLQHLGAQLPTGDPPSSPVEPPSIRVEAVPALQHPLHTLAALSSAAPACRNALRDLAATQVLVALLDTPARPLLLPPRDAAAPPPGLADAVQYARRHLHRPLSVDELAERACMSRSTFFRHFRTAFGTTPLQYVTRLRIEHAQALLHDPERTVTDVSLSLGFGSVSHFIATFKQHTGTTPRAYQQTLPS